MKAQFTLPLPPSVNSYWRNFNGRVLLSKKGREYKQAVWAACLEQKVPKFGGRMLAFKMVIFPKDRRKIDIDNRIKAVLDALQAAGIMEDDWQVSELHVKREDSQPPGKVIITIETVDEPPQA